MNKFKLLILFSLISVGVFSQETKSDSLKNFHFNWIVAPAFTPELGILLSVSGIFSFKTNTQDSLIQKSSLPVSVGYSSLGSIVASGILTSFWKQDKIRVYSSFYLKDTPDNYWGVGYKEANKTNLGDSTAYHRFWWQINPKILFRLAKHFYGGLAVDFNQTIASNMSEKMINDEHIINFGTNNTNIGFGLTGQYDSRDVPVNAYKGIYFSYTAVYYGDKLGGDNEYMSGDIDLRLYKYFDIINGVIAFQSRFRGVTYDAPYAELSQIGTPFDLRGYRWGQYRDNIMFYNIVEYRHMFNRKSKILPMRDGIVLWAGIGTVAHHFNDIKYGLPNVGIGYRIEVQERMNVRFDVGFGNNTMGFYINFNESF